MTAHETIPPPSHGKSADQVDVRPSRRRPRDDTSTSWRLVTAIEVVLAAAAVVADLVLPALVLLGLATVSLLLRRRGPASIGLRRSTCSWQRLTAHMLVFAVAWSLVHLALVIPVTNRVTGQRQDMSDFADLEGNLGMLATLLLLSWTLAAVEEVAFRGYLLTRLRELLGATRVATVAAVGVSSVLFGLLHTEQGLVGVVLTTIDALVFAALRLHYGTLWAPILAHGFNNTLGFVTFYFVGGLYGFW